MQQEHLKRWPALAVLVIAGSIHGLGGAAEPPKRTEPTTRDAQANQNDHRVVFVTGTKARGMAVKDPADKSLGDIDDMIIDRGSGRVRFIVLKSGELLGLGGRQVTAPYRQFGWDSADKHITLSATEQELKSWPTFEKTHWLEGAEAPNSYIRTIGKDYYEFQDSPWPAEAKDDHITPVKGTVRSISRYSQPDGREELVVVVSSPESKDREVILGPSWYMAGNNTIAFYRDAPVEVEVFQVDRHGKNVAMARTVRINGQELKFYDDQGRAYWTPGTSSEDRGPFAASPFVLYSELKGKPVDCRGEKCGTVRDVVMECASGRVAFLVIDPDTAVLGIGDEGRLVPWDVMTRSPDGKVHLDASKSMITSAPTCPDDVKTLSESGFYQKIYGIYDVHPADFGSPRD